MNPLMLAATDTNMQLNFLPFLVVLLPIIIAIAIWDGVWKLIALWKSARNNQLAWFICLAIFNTAGILPIIYILWCQKKPEPVAQPLPPVR